MRAGAQTTARASAAREDRISFAVGSRLLRVEDGISGRLLESLLGLDAAITAADYEAYIARLADVPRYFDQQVANMRAGLARGFSVPRAVLDGRDGSIAAVAELADVVHELEAMVLDDALLLWLQQRAGPRLDAFFVFVSRVGYAWGVILASHPKQSGAQQQVNRLNRQLRPILGGKKITFVRKTMTGSGKRVYTAQVGYASRGEANAFCSQFRAVGGRCIVLKN